MQKNYSVKGIAISFASKKNIRLGSMVLLGLFSCITSHAQIVWNNASTNFDWYNASNWTPNTAPNAWLPSSNAQFIDAGAKTIGIDFSQGNLSIGGITTSYNGVGVGVPPPGSIIIGNSSATPGTLTLNGGLSCLFSPLLIQNNSTGTGKIMNVALVQPITTLNPQFSPITIESNITGIGKGLSISSTSPGTVELTGSNTYTGITTLTGGGGGNSVRLVLNHTGGATLPADNEIVAIDKGRLEILTNQTLANVTLSLNSSLFVGDGATLTITGKLKVAPGRVSVSGTGKIVYAPGASLEYFSDGGSTSSAEFPAINGPTNVSVTSFGFVRLHESRTISGLFTSSFPFLLGNADFTVGGATVNSIIVTDGSGKLFITNIGTAPVTFPVWASLQTGSNPVTIGNGQGLTYGVRVEQGINPAILNNNNAVNRTWYITPSATPAAGVNVSFGYANTHGNAGFNYTAPVDLGQYTTAWNVIQSNITQTQPLATTISTLTANTSSAFVIANSGSIAVEQTVIKLTAALKKEKAILNWAITGITTATIKKIELQRSGNGISFKTLQTLANTAISFTDKDLRDGLNYYRIKLTDQNGKITYSNIVILDNKEDDDKEREKEKFTIKALLPTLITHTGVLQINAVKQIQVKIEITNFTGIPFQNSVHNLEKGANQIQLNLSNLNNGAYQVTVYSTDGEVKTIRFIKQ
jgi:autotransporter-associated beta strand protein